MKKTSKGNGQVHSAVTGALGDLEIRDATTDLLLVPTAADFKGAVRRDPRNCGLSRCVGRMFGATLAIFLKGFAIVDLVGPDGKRRGYRYRLSTTAVKQLSVFDRDGVDVVSSLLGRSIKLLAPSRTSTRAYIRKRSKSYRRSDVGRAVQAERSAQSALRIAQAGAEKAQSQFTAVKRDCGSSSPKIKIAETQSVAAKTELRKAQDRAAKATAKATELRSYPFRPGTPLKPKHFDLTVRNGAGFFSAAAV